MTQVNPAACDSCANRVTTGTCLAFPQGIPDNILVWGEPHNSPTTSQKNKIVWEFAPVTEQEFEQWKAFVEGVVG